MEKGIASKGSLKLAYRLTAASLPEAGGWPGLGGVVIVAAMLVVLGQIMRHGATLHQKTGLNEGAQEPMG